MNPGVKQVVTAVVWAVVALFFSAVVIFCATIIASDVPADGTQRVVIPAQQLEPIVGDASMARGRLKFSRFESQGGQHHAIAVWRGSVRAADYPVVVVDFATSNNNLAVNLTWKRADSPGEIFSTEFSRGSLGPPAILMSEERDWRGTITEIGLYAIGPVPGPLNLGSFRLEPGGWSSTLRALVSEWTAYRGWTQRSINYLRYFPGEEGISPLPYIGLWPVLALLLMLVAGRWLRAVPPGPGAYVLVLVIPWLVIDLFWQHELRSQLQVTRDKFAGKTLEEKHQADDDAWIYNEVRRLRQDVLPPPPARIIIVSSQRGHNYERLKAQYYLLPHNVYNFGKGPRRSALRQGDYLLVMRGTWDPTFSVERQRLEWARRGITVIAREIDTSPLGKLYRLIDPTLEPLHDE
ncbi:MAG: hypothetical protein NXI15_00240 [Gammaproteobacteria bacterium]|nr:hypothetical protein [Gammaproteobacteria bacterium]